MAVNAMFLKSIRITDSRYPNLYKTVVDNYRKTSIDLKVWGYKGSFCRGKCKKNLYKEYKNWMRIVKSILDSKEQEIYENVENQNVFSE